MGTTSIIRIEKNRNYTVMSNYHIKDKSLTLKAKGLMSLMLSLPDDWDYSINGLAAICKEGPDAIKHTLSELEGCGYISRKRMRNEKGQVTGVEYTIYEQPQEVLPDENKAEEPKVENPLLAENETEEPKVENPLLAENETEEPKVENPLVENPLVENPRVENPVQQNTNITNKLNKQNTNLSILSVEDDIKNQIDYDSLMAEHPEDADVIDGIVDIICQYSALPDDGRPVYAGGFAQSPAAVKKRLKKLTKDHIESVLTGIKQSNKPVRHYKAYILAALLNAPCSLKAQSSRTGSPLHKKAPNRFHNFDQREGVDYEELCKIDLSKY